MADMRPLATVEDVEAAFGGEMTAEQKSRADFVLAKLSAAFRRSARQTFTVETYTHRLKVDAGHVLPHRTPVVEVINVFDDEGTQIPHDLIRGFIRVPRTTEAFVTVTYKAGLNKVPEDVKLQIADSARRILAIMPEATAGVTQVSMTVGPFSESRQLASWAVGGQALLSPDDEALAVTYRPKRAGHTWVMRP